MNFQYKISPRSSACPVGVRNTEDHGASRYFLQQGGVVIPTLVINAINPLSAKKQAWSGQWGRELTHSFLFVLARCEQCGH